MSKFITGEELETAVDEIIWKANRDLLIMSPYIKLGDYFKKLFENHLNKPKLHINIIFGKNEGQVNKSFNNSDLEFFKQFPNISLVYVPSLHAKYYANDTKGVLTSINLYDYSFKHNIEYGVLFERKGLCLLSNQADTEIWDKSLEIANEHEVVFVKRPIFEKKLLSSNYLGSKVLLDRTTELYSGSILAKGTRKLDDFEEELHANHFVERPSRNEVEKLSERNLPFSKPLSEKQFQPGYCIRTGEKTPFNPDRPLSSQAYKSWSRYSDENYAEKYCHYSGEPSKGETSVKRPVLYKNWKKANEVKT